MGTVLECACDMLPAYVACVASPKSFVHRVSPSGGEFSLPFEPRSKFVYPQRCVQSNLDVTIRVRILIHFKRCHQTKKDSHDVIKGM